MGKIQINVGQKFNKLTLVEYAAPLKSSIYSPRGRFICECGVEATTSLHKVYTGHTKSCGCLQIKAARKSFTEAYGSHGLTWENSIDGKKNPIIKLFSGMKFRCYNEKCPTYHNYGGRGVKICDEWLNDFASFHDWCMNNGWGIGLELDRRDNDGNYEPDNCRFVIRKINARNKRTNRIIEYKGVKKTIAEFADEYGFKYDNLYERIWMGWSIERAIEQPIRFRRKLIDL